MYTNRTRTHRGIFTTETLSRLGFREHPFLPSADPRFLYLSKQHLAVLDRVQDVINWREGLSVVEGVIGVGKTSIARRLHQMFEFDPEYKTVYIHTATYTTETQAARDIASAFGLDKRRALLDQLRDFLGREFFQSKEVSASPGELGFGVGYSFLLRHLRIGRFGGSGAFHPIRTSSMPSDSARSTVTGTSSSETRRPTKSA